MKIPPPRGVGSLSERSSRCAANLGSISCDNGARIDISDEEGLLAETEVRRHAYRRQRWRLGEILMLFFVLVLLVPSVVGQEDSQTPVEEGEDITGYKDHTISGAKLTNGEYPMTTLSCYSSYTKPDGQLICPEARSKFCVKELSTLKQDLCGESQYFGDQYIDNLCVLKKCSAECEEGQYPFTYGGLEYVRVRYCCQDNYCNSASRKYGDITFMVGVVSSLISVIIFLV